MQKTHRLLENIDLFIQDRRASNLSKKSIQWYIDTLDKWYKFSFLSGIEDVESITPTLIRLYLLDLKEKGHNDGGVHGYYRSLKVFLNFFENEFQPDDWKNPILRIKPPRMIVEPIEGIGVDNIKKLLSLCDKATFLGSRDTLVLSVLTETGVRASELLQINIEDIDFSDSSITIRNGKGRKPRIVFIGSTCRKQLRKYLNKRKSQDGALFITNQGTRLTFSGLRQIIRRLCKQAGMEEEGLHSFRRTFAIEQLRQGVDIQTIARLLGHSSLQVVSRYLKQTKTDLRMSYRSIIDS